MRLSSNLFYKHNKDLYAAFRENCEEHILVVAEDMVTDRIKHYYVTKPAMKLIERIKLGDVDYAIFNKLPDMNIAIAFNGLEEGIVHVRIQDRIMSILDISMQKSGYMSYNLVRVNVGSGQGEWRYAIDVVDGWNEEMEAHFRKTTMRVLVYLFLSDVSIQMIPIHGSNGLSKKNGKILNDTMHGVSIVTSKWNTLTMRAGGFEVGGHFRLQPYGRDRKQVKLKYIAPYRKKGYTRRN